MDLRKHFRTALSFMRDKNTYCVGGTLTMLALPASLLINQLAPLAGLDAPLNPVARAIAGETCQSGGGPPLHQYSVDGALVVDWADALICRMGVARYPDSRP